MSAPGADESSPVARAETLAAATKLLQDAKITRPPTPVEDLLAYCGLELDTFLISDPYVDRGLPVPLAKAQADLRPLVRGMVDVTGHVVYIHRNLGREQSRFVTMHELGHYYLTWHNLLLQTCSEADLSPAARRAWEREANLFARALLFQNDRFARDAARAEFGWKAVRAMAKSYAASLESAGWEFVQAQRRPALLMVAALGDAAKKSAEATSGQPLLQVRYAVASRSWWDRYGRSGVPEPGTPVPWNHPATRVLLSGSRAVLREDAVVGSGIAVRAELLGNGQDVLLLAMPI